MSKAQKNQPKAAEPKAEQKPQAQASAPEAKQDGESKPEDQPDQQAKTEEAAKPAAQPVIVRVEQARALIELSKEEKAKPAGHDKSVILSFKSLDGRTLRVVEAGGKLYSQEA